MLGFIYFEGEIKVGRYRVITLYKETYPIPRSRYRVITPIIEICVRESLFESAVTLYLALIRRRNQLFFHQVNNSKKRSYPRPLFAYRNPPISKYRVTTLQISIRTVTLYLNSPIINSTRRLMRPSQIILTKKGLG